MDALDALMAKARRREKRNRSLWNIVIFLVATVVICAVLLYANHFNIQVTLNGGREVTLQYGEGYTEAGAGAVFTGRVVPQKDIPLEVNIRSPIGDGKVGTYEIEYAASYGIWRDSVVRTVHIVDNVAPVILLKKNAAAYTIPGQSYQEEGFLAVDNHDGDLTDKVQITQKNGKVIYSVDDSSGNRTEITRKIVYYDPIAPEITMNGDETIVINAGEIFEDPGFTALDNSAGDLTDQVKVKGKVNIYRAGTYQLEYQVKDAFGNTAMAVRTVEVKSVPQPKVIKPEGKVIYLTFDDGPSAYTEDLLEVLREYDVKVTFFVCNTDRVDLLKQIAEDGHAIGIHTVSHDYKTIYASEEAYFADLFGMQKIIEDHTGIKTTLVRFPGGGSNTVSRFNPGIMTRLAQALHDMGFQYFDWNVDSDDAGRSKTTKKVLKNVKKGVEEVDVAIVLQHDVKKYSVKAVEDIILWGLEEGYEFRALDPTSPTFHHKINN
ncbi:MAG: polysaccharide deacetylase family protein [Oscillospiraceae bacterium]|nr:polysaccharide deacetylase family protein [Oscillospiraceae bacterium]